MGSCTSSHLDAPADFRGKVYALQAGQCVTHDRDLGSGWKHLAAVRRDGRLELFVDGLKTAESPALSGSPLDVTNGQPLRLEAGGDRFLLWPDSGSPHVSSGAGGRNASPFGRAEVRRRVHTAD